MILFFLKLSLKFLVDTADQTMRVVYARRGALIFPLFILSFVLGQPPETLPPLPQVMKIHNIILPFEDH